MAWDSSVEHREQGLAHQLVQPGARDAFIRRRRHLRPERARQGDVQLQDRPRRSTRPATRRSPASSRSARLASAAAAEPSSTVAAAASDAAKRVSHLRPSRSWSDQGPARRRHRPPASTRGADLRRRGAVEQRLLHRDVPCGKRSVVIGVIDGVEGEVGGGELPLGQKRSEHEHGVVADEALPARRSQQTGQADAHGAFSSDQAFDQLRRIVLDAAAAEGIEVIDLREALRDEPEPERMYAPDSHFSRDGAAFAADVISRRLTMIDQASKKGASIR